jgi:hypothetical protein
MGTRAGRRAVVMIQSTIEPMMMIPTAGPRGDREEHESHRRLPGQRRREPDRSEDTANADSQSISAYRVQPDGTINLLNANGVTGSTPGDTSPSNRR